MSYNLIIVLLLVMLPINSLIAFLCYRQGLKDGYTKEQKQELKPILNVTKEKPKLTEEQKRLNTLLENVNNYKGNGIGQREVK